MDLDRLHKLLRGHIYSQVNDLYTRPFQHHAHKILADVMQVSLDRPQYHLGKGLDFHTTQMGF